MPETGVLEALLSVQAHDIVADQLRHRRARLPEREALGVQSAAVAGLDQELTEVGARRDELGRTQKRLEDEISSLEARITETDRKLYSGTVAAPRELQAMQESIGAMQRRVRSLEDDLLEVLEATEPVVAEQEALVGRRAGHQREATRLGEAIGETEGEVDRQLAVEVAARATDAAAVPADLLATYDDLRRRLGGIGVARLDGARCGGCHLTLPATEIDRIRRQPPDALVRHEECGRILVRPSA